MTIRELRQLLAHQANGEDEVRVVFHGYDNYSFNLPVTTAKSGGVGGGYLIIVEEERRERA